ncbi:prepilin-type N-terminal cleavage/methylation domain-containing protein [Pyxidicoccus parkwayensis]|uniref:Prepilin-type N-terminal cleavage/methylation domain-containing protein n=1 Tax=Pyxidicoccus parkwayensis TaxID=2813578 RepID=A0ABX7NRQ8_9BACT|nr:prepilin-type N-terminal cleavage/methylation domain-containing protein [Pyxidicoccus parkwaysis]QSQ20230.1 prepilin-type N-terminal cleavage/methylation domain-containing protein [Pyxidicoccus parkwaysis]
MTTKRARSAPRGFTLIEVLIASAISLVVLGVAVVVGAQLQRRGYMEERTVETQNAARAARDLMAAGVQRAGAGAGTLPLAVGTKGAGVADLRYAVWPVSDLAAAGAGVPAGQYAGLTSNGLELWETDPGKMVPLAVCNGTGAPWVGTKLCTGVAPPAELDGRVAALVAPEPPARATVCLGVISNLDTTKSPPGDNDYGLTWTPGLPGNPLPAGHPCASYPAATANTLWAATDIYLMPLTARSYRVNWTGGSQPALEMDPDGFAGNQGFTVVSRDIEQLRVRMGVVNPEDAGMLYFPNTAPNRPGLDQCTHAACAGFVTWDAGVALAGDEGPGSARDELLKQVRMVELDITARSQRLDTTAQTSADGGVDRDGNLQDGYKRRHTVIRLAPRNFGYSGF